MGITRKGWNDQFMMSGFTKEDSYDAGATAMTATHAFSLKGFTAVVTWDDEVANDKEEVTGQEHGTDQEIIKKSVAMTVTEPKAKPNTVAAFATLVLGAVVTTKDSTDDAYRHKITPIAIGSATPSMEVGHKKGGIQYKYTGIKGNSLKLSAEEGGFLQMEAELMGSGTRASDATAFPAVISESWMKMSNADCWIETAANITVTATLVQETEDISSATPDDLGARFKSFELMFNNNSEKQIGTGATDGVAHDIDPGRRSIELKFTLNFDNATAAAEFNYYLNQDAIAFEIDLKGSVIDLTAPAGVPLYYGVQIIVPRGKLRLAPLPVGGPSDILTQEFELDVQDDGTNAPLIIEVYNAQPGNGVSGTVGYLGASS